MKKVDGDHKAIRKSLSGVDEKQRFLSDFAIFSFDNFVYILTRNSEFATSICVTAVSLNRIRLTICSSDYEPKDSSQDLKK